MNGAPGSNWQIMLADLSIILFLMTFSALAHSHASKSTPAVHRITVTPSVGEPVAIWRSGGNTPTLGTWLQSQAPDPRMRINVQGGYQTGHRDRILADATAISADPALVGRDVRLILEPAADDFVTVTLSYDRT